MGSFLFSLVSRQRKWFFVLCTASVVLAIYMIFIGYPKDSYKAESLVQFEPLTANIPQNYRPTSAWFATLAKSPPLVRSLHSKMKKDKVIIPVCETEEHNESKMDT